MKNVLISLVIPIASADEKGISLYMQKRAAEEMAGLWEFPGGKIEPGEVPEQAARREFLEECTVKLDQVQLFKIFNYQYPDKNICFYSYLTRQHKPLGQFKEFSFAPGENSQKYAGEFPPANYGLIDQVIEYLAGLVKSGDYAKLWT